MDKKIIELDRNIDKFYENVKILVEATQEYTSDKYNRKNYKDFMISKAMYEVMGSPSIDTKCWGLNFSIRILCRALILDSIVKYVFKLIDAEELNDLINRCKRHDQFWWCKSAYHNTYHTLCLPEHNN